MKHVEYWSIFAKIKYHKHECNSKRINKSDGSNFKIKR